MTKYFIQLQLWVDGPDVLEGLMDQCQRAWRLIEERQRRGKAGNSSDNDNDDDDDNDDDADDEEEAGEEEEVETEGEEEEGEEIAPPAKLRKRGASHVPEGFSFNFF